MTNFTRRAAIQHLGLGTLAVAAPGLAFAQPRAVELGGADRTVVNAVAEAVVKKFDVPGLSVAIAHRGQLVYQQGFGFANKQSGEKVTPAHLFRIASVSKPITSVAIFTLVERGKLRLADKVFGPRGILGTDYGGPPYKQHVESITVDHLLTHTAGGWSNDRDDPMFVQPKMDHKELITWTIANRPLRDPPGTKYAYSNFGYCVLGRIIEKLGGESYQGFVRNQVLERCGVRDMRIAGSTLAHRLPSEVVYYGEKNDDPYGMNIERLDAHGGWLASAPDLVQFLVHVDGFPTVADILKADTIRTMTTAAAASPGYARGWEVNRQQNWWHGGSLPGTTTLMVRTSGGLCWAALANGRRSNPNAFDGAIDGMVWDMVGKVKAWSA